MRFGPTRIEEALGAILAHSIRAGKVVLKKGRVLTEADLNELQNAQVHEVIAARLGQDDVHEDEAARRLAVALAGPGAKPAAPYTGRVNLVAEAKGLVLLDRALIDQINQLDKSITVATLAPYARVDVKDLLATIKIIPFAAPATAIAQAEALLAKAQPAISIAPFKPMSVAYVTSDKPSDKTVRVTEDRLTRLGSSFAGTPISAGAHAEAPLTTAIAEALQRKADLILVQGRSATVDRRDVVPAAIVAAGGRITHFGMPVDPGNLLTIAEIGAAKVIVLPGCARSPKENGFDWVLERMAAGLEVKSQDIQAMGVGGLLKETGARGLPRTATPAPTRLRIAGVLLAAGLSRRMGTNKLLQVLRGKPLVRHAAEALAAAPLSRRVAVLGHQADEVERALAGLPIEIVRAPGYELGMSQSLKAGLQAITGQAEAVLVMLGDMPSLKPAHIERMIAAFDPEEGRTICVPVFEGRRGNPVLFGSAYFEELMTVEGDMGGRAVIESNRDAVAEVPMPDDAILNDVDTPEALKALE